MKTILNFIGNVLEASKSWIPVITAIAILFLAASFTGCTSELPGIESVENTDHVPSDSVQVTPIDNFKTKGDPITFENYNCLSIYDGVNQFTIENPIPGGHIYFIIKFANGNTRIVYVDGEGFVNIGVPICGVQIIYLWANDESYTLAETLDMARDIANGSQVERPDTESCTVMGECTPDALTGNE